MKEAEVDDGTFVRSASMVSVNHVVWGRIKKRENQLESVWSTIFYPWSRKDKKVENGVKTELVFDFKQKIYNSLKEEEIKSTM